MGWNPNVMPTTHPDASTYEMSDVGLFPAGASKDGVEDLLGLIYHWTDEYADPHTRRAVLRGANAFQPQRFEEARYQPWYFPGLFGDWKDGDPWGPPYTLEAKDYSKLFNLTAHGNYLLMCPSLDRAGTVGFRCVADGEDGPSPAPAPAPAPAPDPTPAPTPAGSCSAGDVVTCPTSMEMCAGNQCCQDGSTCPSADATYSLCPQPKTFDCTQGPIL